ncbi:hypothetical protein pb186bvf_013019 [Paramecium bursaria]
MNYYAPFNNQWMDNQQATEEIELWNHPCDLLQKIQIELQFSNQKEFIPKFIQRVRNYKKTQQLIKGIPEAPTCVEILLSNSYFPIEVPLLKRIEQLQDIVIRINQKIHSYFRSIKKQISNLSKEQLRLDSLEEVTQIVIAPSRKIEDFANYKIPTRMDCTFCVCQNKPRHRSKSIIRCLMCLNLYHIKCLKLENTSKFICPECIIQHNDPLHPIIDLLQKPVIFLDTLRQYSFQMGLLPKGYEVEARCLRLDGKSDDAQWPDLGEICLNGKKVKEFKPLMQNSSCKRRKDDSIRVEGIQENSVNIIMLKEGLSTIDQRQQYRINVNQRYMFLIAKVQVLSSEQLVKQTQQNIKNWMGIQQCRNMIKLNAQCMTADDFATESIKISLNCQMFYTLIDTPIRGTICDHIQCFSLENMCSIMKSCTPRRWRCPICKSLILNIYIDSYQYTILQLIKQYDLKLTDISFDKEGQVEQPDIQRLLTQEYINNLPDYVQDNSIRVIPLEILAQKILNLSQVFNNEDNIIDLESQITGTEIRPIEID